MSVVVSTPVGDRTLVTPKIIDGDPLEERDNTDQEHLDLLHYGSISGWQPTEEGSIINLSTSSEIKIVP
jgi:hypothetical protein